VGHGEAGHEVGARDRPGLVGHAGIARGVPVVVGHRGAVRTGGPQALEHGVVTVDVVPAAVDDAAVVQDAGLPLIRLAIRETLEPLTQRIAPVEHVGGRVAPTVAAAEALIPGGDEDDVSVGQVARVEVLDRHALAPGPALHRVDPRHAGDLPGSAGVEVVFVDVVRPRVGVLHRVVAEAEQHAARIVGQVRVQDGARRQLALEQVLAPCVLLPR